MAACEIPTTDRPSLRDLREQLGLRPIPREDPATVELQSRCMAQAWVLFETAAAHIMYVQRQLAAADGLSDGSARFVTEEFLHQWAAHPHDFAALADELVAEAADHARRP